jgi:hypothetical protein
MSDFIEAVLVFGLCGFVGLGGCGAGTFILIVRFFNQEAGKKLGEIFQQLMGIFGLIGCVALYVIFYT